MEKYKIIGQYDFNSGALQGKIPERTTFEQEFEAETDEQAIKKGKEIWATASKDFPGARFVQVVKPIGYIKF